MKAGTLAKRFTALALVLAAAACTSSKNDGNARYIDISLPLVTGEAGYDPLTDRNNAGIADYETRRRIMDYRKAYKKDSGERCSYSDRLDDRTGLFSYQLTDRFNIGIGVKGDGTRASNFAGKDPDVAISFSFALGPSNVDRSYYRDECLGNSKWRGMVPSGARLAPDVLREHRDIAPLVADPLIRGFRALGYD